MRESLKPRKSPFGQKGVRENSLSNKRDITLGNRFKKQVVEVEVRNNRRPRYVSAVQKEPSKEEMESKKLALDNFELSSASLSEPIEKKADQNTKNRAIFFGEKKNLKQPNRRPYQRFHHQDQQQGRPYQGQQSTPNNPSQQKRPPYNFQRPFVQRPATDKPIASFAARHNNKKPFPLKRPPILKTDRPERPLSRPFQPRPFITPFLPGKKLSSLVTPEPQKKQQYRKNEYKPERSSKSKTPLGPVNNIQLGHRFIGRIDSEEDVSINLERQRSASSIKRAREKQKKINRVIRDVTIFKNVSVSSLSSSMAVSVSDVLERLKQMDILADRDTKLDVDTANLIVQEFGHNAKLKEEPLDSIRIDEGLEEDKEQRAPIVTVVGHVDHGKTSLLDALRMTQFTSKESGGITQSIGASQVFTKDGRFITFIDTPGHQIFTEMRARGVNITDIVLVIIAGDEGIKDQTIESIQHAKASKAFIIVVFTKADKPDTNIDKIKQMLFQYDIAVESMGGDVPDIEVSSKTGHNLKALIELILFCADAMNLRASQKPKASGIILESNLDKSIGPVATLIIKNGTLKTQDSFLSGNTYGKVKAIRDWTGKILKSAGPSYPVQVMGFDETPAPGQDFIVMSEQEARDLSVKRKELVLSKDTFVEDKLNKIYTVNDILNALTGKKETHQMNFIIKADSSGSVEAIVSSILKLKLENTECAVILKGVGAVTESDIMLAKTSDAVVVAFKVDAPSQVSKTAQSLGIEVKRYNVIYKIIDDIEDQVLDRLRPKEEEVSLGRAIVRQVFSKPKLPTIAGCYVTEGILKRDAKCIVSRDGIQIYESKILSLKHMKDDRREVKTNQECGLIVENFVDYKTGDIIECFEKRAIG